MKSILKKVETILKTSFALTFLASSIGIYGDDTEVFYSVNVSKPNLLFVLDVSGSMSTNATTAAASTATLVRQIATSADDGYQAGSNQPIQLDQTNHRIDNTNSLRFRFTNIDIPQGANITDAYIQFESSLSDNGYAKFKTYSERTDNAPATVPSYWTLSYYSGVDWEPQTNWQPGDRGVDQRVDVEDVTQDIIDRNGWVENNAIAYYVDADEGARSVAMFDDPNRAAPELHIEYEIPAVIKDRLQVMQESLRAVLEEAPDNIKVGLMNYGLDSINPEVNNNYPENKRHHSVSGITFPVTDINAKAREIIPTTADVYGLPGYPDENITIREYLADIADSWNHNSYTPIVDALYEAALYYRGEKIHYGQNLPTINGAHPVTYDGPVVTTDVHVGGRDRANAPKYKTPIESSCQENYIVLMTDGAPTYRDSGWTVRAGPFATIRNTANGPQGPLASAITSCATAAGVGLEGNCGAELTHYIANNDNLPDPTGSFPMGQEGDQLIKTFTIGFGTGAGTDTESYLKSLATYDDLDTTAGPNEDGYFLATDPASLAAAFKDILEEVAAPKGTLASPGYSVNVKNGLEHEKDIYIPVFDRKNASRWSGNLKKFKIVDVDGRRLIRGKNNENATDELGNFTSNAIDYWSDATNADPDGRAVEKGGLANMLDDPDARKIYSNLSGNSNVTLSNPGNLVSLSNITNISNADLGITSSGDNAQDLEYRKTLINFMRGWKDGDATSSDKEVRLYMGDMLHSEPIVITYETGATDADKVQYIFAGTNEGYLHAFDTNTGEEKFAFIPAELLAKLPEHLYLNAGTQADHKYGVDGVITADIVRNDAGKATKVILYFGMRRGGNSYFALDVTDLDNPKLLWKKGKPDTATTPATALDSMGQSWSTPYIAKVGVGSAGTATEAVLMSGGYDVDEDRDLNDGNGQLDVTQIGTKIPADEGNNIYIYSADSAGTLLWSMPASMRSQITNSIPGGLRPLDTNYNGLIDRIYFADTGGNVWRIDLSENLESDGSGGSHLTKIASLGGTGVNNRMFFNEPDVTTLKLNGKNVFGIALGSGFRAHPLDETIHDKFFYLIDESPYKPLDTTITFPAITVSDLAPINLSGGSVGQPSGTIKDPGKRGWMINLPDDGEKVLGTSIAVDGNIIFTTLVPEVLASGAGIDQCAAPVTQSRIYAFNVLSGEPGLDLDMDGDIDDSDAYVITGTEILGKPQIVFNTPEFPAILDADGNDTGEVSCTHPVDIRTGKKLSQATGYEACRLESIYWSDPVKE